MNNDDDSAESTLAFCIMVGAVVYTFGSTISLHSHGVSHG